VVGVAFPIHLSLLHPPAMAQVVANNGLAAATTLSMVTEALMAAIKRHDLESVTVLLNETPEAVNGEQLNPPPPGHEGDSPLLWAIQNFDPLRFGDDDTTLQTNSTAAVATATITSTTNNASSSSLPSSTTTATSSSSSSSSSGNKRIVVPVTEGTLSYDDDGSGIAPWLQPPSLSIRRSLGVIQLLLDRRADVNYERAFNPSEPSDNTSYPLRGRAIHRAVRFGASHWPVVQLLLRYNAQVNLGTGGRDNDHTLSIAMSLGDSNGRHFLTLQALIAAGADVNAFKNGDRAIHKAISILDMDAIRLFLGKMLLFFPHPYPPSLNYFCSCS
jgi:hypothetical protein